MNEVKLKQYKRQIDYTNVKKPKDDHHSLIPRYLKQLKEKYGQQAVDKFLDGLEFYK